MNSLEIFVDKCADDYALPYSEGDVSANDVWAAFKVGFEAATDLQLPIKFHNWVTLWKTMELGEIPHTNDANHIKQWVSITHAPVEELYAYWLENVFKP